MARLTVLVGDVTKGKSACGQRYNNFTKNPFFGRSPLFLEAKRHAHVWSNGLVTTAAAIAAASTIKDMKRLPGAKPESAE
jgi:hypothetical protein